MQGPRQDYKREKKPPKPLDSARLEELALAYVARFATSTSKLERYLKRKLRERGWEGEEEPDIGELVRRYAELRYVDDEAFARAKADSLLRRGYGARRVRQALGEAGIGEEIRDSMAPNEASERHAAFALARKRRFGPFAPERPDPARREKQLAAMLRAGHSMTHAKEVLDASSPEAAEEWAHELDEEDDADF
jgi:regulatory protein